MPRRRFLLVAGVATGAVFAWRFLLPASGGGFSGLRYLSQNQARVLAAVYGVIVPGRTREQESEAIRFLDRFIAQLDAGQRMQLSAAFHLLEHTPLLFHGFLPRFSRLSPERQARCLEGWRDGGSLRRPLYAGLKELILLAHYSLPSSWAALGYNGPMVPEGYASPREAFYKGLLAPEDAA